MTKVTLRRLWLTALLTLTACGGSEIGGRAQLTLELPVFSSSDVLKVFVLGQDLKGGSGKLSCAMITNNEIALAASAVEILAEDSANARDLEAGAVTLSLEDIPAGPDRVFAAEVVDINANQRRGIGCTANIEIVANQSVEVPIEVTEL